MNEYRDVQVFRGVIARSVFCDEAIFSRKKRLPAFAKMLIAFGFGEVSAKLNVKTFSEDGLRLKSRLAMTRNLHMALNNKKRREVKITWLQKK